VTKNLNVSQRRIEDAATASINAVRNDSSRVDSQAFNSQELAEEDWSVIRKIPRSVSSTRQRRAYDDVTKEVSYDTPFQAVSNETQQIIRQQRLSHAHSDLSADHPNVVAVRQATKADLLGARS
jgi:hypothetical protein